MTVTIHHADMREVLARLVADGVQVQSVVCDPPYHLTSIVKRFGAENAAAAKSGTKANHTGAYARASRGFMGKQWDGGDIAFQAETWRLCWDLLPPGGHLVAFSGTRTYHRMACAIEDAGFEIRDMLSWLYGSGFPKSHDVAKGIDKAAGREIEIVPVGKPIKRMIPGADQARDGWEKNNGREYQPGEYVPSEEAAPWGGWGTALKPALEPICFARKPLEGTVAANVLKHGTGAINIDGCRVGTADNTARTDSGTALGRMNDDAWKARAGVNGGHNLGRWPANVLHDGSDEVVAAFPRSSGQQASTSTSTSTREQQNCYGAMAKGSGGRPPRGDEGSAARFFYSSKADADDRLGSKHPTVKPVDLMRWLVRLVTPPGGTVLDPFAGSGTTGMACLAEGFDCILVEREAEYAADIRRRIAHVSGADTPLFSQGAA